MARSSKALQQALSSLQGAAAETDKVLDHLADKSEELSKRSSTALVGTFGGLLGLGCAYGISLAVVGASFIIAAPILSGVGVVGGVLLMRGGRRIRLERAIGNNRMAADELLDRIKSLPSNAPPEVAEDLWTAYRSLTSSLHNETTNLNKELKIPELKLLPGPSPELLRLRPPVIDASFVPVSRPEVDNKDG